MNKRQGYIISISVKWKEKNILNTNIVFDLLKRRNIIYLIFSAILFLVICKTSAVHTALISFIGLSLLVFIFIAEIDSIKAFSTKYNRWINNLSFIVSSILSFVMVELMAKNYNIKMFVRYGCLNILLYLLIYFIIQLIVQNISLTIFISTILIYLSSFANYCVTLFRGSPILPSDLTVIRTAISVMSNYQFRFSTSAVLALLLFIFILILTSKLIVSKNHYPKKQRNKLNLMYILYSCLILVLLFNTNLINKIVVNMDLWDTKNIYDKYGNILGFAANTKALIVSEPEGYSYKNIENYLYSNFEQSEISDSNTQPNIIAIMNEAYSDLSVINSFTTDIDYRPFTSNLNENTVKGNLLVSVHGGLTSNTEYEFLTGNSLVGMPLGSVPYQQFVNNYNKDSLVSTLKNYNYDTIAIHPYYPNSYSRNKIYKLFGFDQFLSINDFANPTYIRSYISDRSDYNKIIDLYNNKEKGKPLFIFNVTMQNHGGYSQDIGNIDQVKLNELTGFPKTERYLSLIRESDLAFEQLINYFSNQSEPTIIVLFGDHQPAIEEEFYETLYGKKLDELTLSEHQKRYMIPFMIWANYDIPEANYDVISANYLSSLLLSTAGLKLPVYNQYLLELMKDIPAINTYGYIDRDNVYYTLEEKSQYKDILSFYKDIIYNNVFDKSNRLGWIFNNSMYKEKVN